MVDRRIFANRSIPHGLMGTVCFVNLDEGGFVVSIPVSSGEPILPVRSAFFNFYGIKVLI